MTTVINGTGLTPDDRARLDEQFAEETRRWQEAFDFQRQEMARQRAWNEGQLIAQATFNHIGKQVQNTLDVMQSGIRDRLNAEFRAEGGDPGPESRFGTLDLGQGGFDPWQALAELPRRERTTWGDPVEVAEGAAGGAEDAAGLAGSSSRRVSDG